MYISFIYVLHLCTYIFNICIQMVPNVRAWYEWQLCLIFHKILPKLTKDKLIFIKENKIQNLK